MGLLEKLRIRNKYERGANYELGHSLSSSAVSTLFGTGGSHINVLEEYSGFVWKCINVRSEALANENIFVQRRVGDKWQDDQNHEFNVVLEGQEGQADLSEMLEAHQVCMDLYGESFWYYSKGESQRKPMGVYLLDPNAITVFVQGGRVTGYVYQKDAERITFELDEIDHYYIHDPRRPFRGVGPMQSAGWFIRSSRYVNTYINNFLENNAIPAGVIVAKGQVNDDDWKLFKAQWAEKYSGIDNAGKTGFVRGSDLDFVKTGLSLGEVDFEKIKNTSRDDIMAMFGVSKPMIGIYDDINRASAVTARQLFALTHTSPALMRITRKLSKKVGVWYGENFRMGSTNPIPEDREVKLQEYDKGIGRWVTVNEARAAYGLEPIADGDVLKPVQTAPTEAKKLGKITIRTKNNKADFSYEMKESFRSKMEDLQVKYEQQFFQKANKVLKAQRDMVLDQLEPKKIVAASFDPENESQKLVDEVLPLFMLLAAEQGQLSAEFAGSADTVFELTPVMKKYIADSVKKSTLGFSKETQEKIATAITEGLTAGESIAKVGKRINTLYEDLLGVKTPGFRTERLARTEIIKASNEITEAAYRQTGVVQKKEWFANPGHCQFCASLNGSILKLGSVFLAKGQTLEGADGGTRLNDYEDVKHPPAHSSCRCTLIPVIGD